MRKIVVLLGVAALAVILATAALAANRGVTFTSIGFIENPGAFPASSVTSMNPEGTVFMANPSYFGNYCVEWTREGGWGTLVGAAASVCDISSNGTIMASGVYPASNPLGFPGTLPSSWPGTWTGVQDVWNQIPPNPDYPMGCTGSSSMSFLDMGGDGDYATGLTYVQTTTPTNCATFRAFRWDKATNTTVALGVPPGGRGTRGNGISADGSTIVGWGRGVQFDRRGARWVNGTWSWFGDPNGIEPKKCITSGGACVSNSGSASSGCPEYVDDGSCTNKGACQGIGTCQNRGVCTANICVGGTNPGASCTSNSQCKGACLGGTNDGTVCTSNSACTGACVGGTNPGTNCSSSSACEGTCVGPNAGANCKSNSACPDTLVCVPNPDWNDRLFKGETYAVTSDGGYACGRNYGYDYPDGWNNGYRANPDGTFTPIPPPESFPDFVDPFAISADGKTMVGRVGNSFFGAIPFFWKEGIGTQDLQMFLVQQGLDELFFWQLTDLFAVSADGKIMGGRGINPDGWIEGIIVDISKVWICHQPPGHPGDARTLGIDSDSAADHLSHGDFLGTCEFLNSGGLSRAAELRQRLSADHNQSVDPYQTKPADPFHFKWSTQTRRNPWGAPVTRKVMGGKQLSPRD